MICNCLACACNLYWTEWTEFWNDRLEKFSVSFIITKYTPPIYNLKYAT